MKHNSQIKRLLSVLLCLVMVFSLFPASAFAEGAEEAPAQTNAQVEPAADAVLEPVAPAEESAPAPVEPVAPVEAAPNLVYATVEEFNAAIEEMGDATDEESTRAVIAKCLDVYSRLSPEDQAAQAEVYAYIQSYAQDLGQSEAETLAYDPTRTIYLYTSVNGGSVARVTPKWSQVKGKTLAYIVKTYFPSYYRSTNTYKHRSNSYGSWFSATYVEDTSYQDILIANWHTHSYTWTAINDSQHQQTCSCGQTSGSAQSHSRSVRSSTAATCNAVASTTYYCSTCSHTWTEYGSSYATHTWGGWYNNGKGQEQRDCNYGVHHEYRNIQTQKYTVTYYDRGSEYSKATYNKGATVTVLGCGNTNTGYTFKGWTCNGYSWEVGDTFTINSDTVFTAVWEKTNTTANYTVQWYDTDGETLKAPEIRFGTVGNTVSATSPDKSINGYRYLEDKSTASARLEASGTVLTLRFVRLVSATWKDGYTSTPIMTVTVAKDISDEDLNKLYPTDPTREGFKFDGWTVARDGNGNITITAKWAENTPAKPDKPTTAELYNSGATFTLQCDDKSGHKTTMPIVANTNNKWNYDWCTYPDNVTESGGTYTYTATLHASYWVNWYGNHVMAQGQAEDVPVVFTWNAGAQKWEAPSSAVIIHVQGVKKTYIWYDENGTTELDRQEVSKCLSAPTYSGETPTKATSGTTSYEFEKWAGPYTDSDGNTCYKAQYKAQHLIKYTLNYHANTEDPVQNMPENHTETSAELTHTMKVSGQIPTREGYTFSHWTIGPEGARYDSGADFAFEATSSQTSSVSFEMYAHWTENIPAAPTTAQIKAMDGRLHIFCEDNRAHNLNWDLGYSGEWCDRSAQVTKGDDGKYHWHLTVNVDKWVALDSDYLKEHRESVNYDHIKSDETTEPLVVNFTYVGGEWTMDSEPYIYIHGPKITYRWLDADGNVIFEAKESACKPAPGFEGEEPQKAEDENNTYEFDKWSDPVVDTDNGTVTYEPVYKETPKEDQPDEPDEPETVTVTYRNGDEEETEEVQPGEIIVRDMDEEREGYTFGGWQLEDGSIYQPGDHLRVEEDTVLTAVWNRTTPTEPTDPTDPTNPTEPTGPETPNDPVAPVIPPLPNLPGLAPIDLAPVTIDDAVVPAAAEVEDIDEDEVPLASAEDVYHQCCVLHLILSLVALTVAIYYTHSRKKAQERVAEMEAELLDNAL